MVDTILFIVIGLAAGVLSGMFGIGGGVIIVPALMYFCKFSQLKAQGTSLAVLLPPAGLVAFIQYYKRGQVDVKAGILVCVFLVIGSVFGSKIADNVPIPILKKSFGVMMILISLKMIFSK
ncbi:MULTISPECIES: sulfite exporter TauE/SafE family protein [Clostridium]|uniref:Probable membrane transporter protein n=1 Tax=Clostridium cibarium TaxID=2762247 RepID=A0ABR8PX89_9CLOT|nr:MULTISPECIES: sulfite exporter TauE/SafE family protein [Clostridium]MBD7912775.1 sulfite exporter TauE/SafE family protein [Clostridium cibarium]